MPSAVLLQDALGQLLPICTRDGELARELGYTVLERSMPRVTAHGKYGRSDANVTVSPSVCACGARDCREMGWPHEWDPIAPGDTCMFAHDEQYAFGENRFGDWVIGIVKPAHRHTEPYVRVGSGDACAGCVPEDPC